MGAPQMQSAPGSAPTRTRTISANTMQSSQAQPSFQYAQSPGSQNPGLARAPSAGGAAGTPNAGQQSAPHSFMPQRNINPAASQFPSLQGPSVQSSQQGTQSGSLGQWQGRNVGTPTHRIAGVGSMGSSTTQSSAVRGPPSAASLPSSLGGSAGPSPMSMGFPSPASKPILSGGAGANTPDGVVSFSLGQDIGDDLPSTTPTHRKSTRVSFAARRDSDFLPSDLNGGDDVQGGPSTLVCPALHMLSEFVTPGEGWKCNLCTTVVGSGHTMHSCRQCNYDVCQSCFDRGAQARASRRDSSSSEEEEVAPLPSGPLKSRNSFVDGPCL